MLYLCPTYFHSTYLIFLDEYRKKKLQLINIYETNSAMPLFKKKEANNNHSRHSFNATEDKRSSSSKSGGGFFSKKKDDKRSQPQDQSTVQQQALMYGMSLKGKRDQDLEERQAIEKKMAKQSGKKYRGGGGRSKTEDAKTALKVYNFVKNNK